MVTSTRSKPRRASGTRRTASKATPKPTASAAPDTAPTSATPVVADPVVDMLNRYGFTYDLVTLPLAAINRKASQLNQARIAKPIDEDQVLIYAEQMRNGDQFPPIVAYRNSDGLYIVMDGNHRVAGYDIADVSTMTAYVVRDPSPAQIQSFTFEANTKHGMPTSLADRLRHAVFLIEQEVPKHEAARRLGIAPNTLSHYWDSYQADKRFRSLGIRKFDALSPTAKRKLDSIHSDPVLKAAAELALEASLSSEELGNLVRDLNAIRAGEREQMRFIASQREAKQATIKATAGGRIPIPVAVSNLSRVTTTINHMDVPKLIEHLRRLPSEVRSAQAVAASESVTKLMDIVRAIQQQG